MQPPKPRPWQDFSPRKRRTVNAIIRHMSQLNSWLYRRSSGRIGGSFFGTQVCLLTTTGRKSGLPRTAPLLYLRQGDDLVIVASKGGDFRHPLWYLNLQAHPDVTVQINDETFACSARTASAQEKEAIWPRLVEYYPSYQDYQDIAERDIPVVFLTPVG